MELTTTRDLQKHFYKSNQDPQIKKDQELVTKQVKEFVKKWKNNTKFQTHPTECKEALDQYEKIHSSKIDKNYGYSQLAFYTQMGNSNIKAYANSTEERRKKLSQELYFFELELAKINTTNQSIFLKNKLLAPYKHFLKRIFESAKYNLNEQEEKIISNLGKTSYNNRIDLLESKLSKEEVKTKTGNGKKENKTFYELFGLSKSTNKSIRDEAAKHINDIIKKHLDTAEHELNSILEYKYQIDKMRKYPSPETSRYIADDVEQETIYPLLEAVKENYKTAKNYYKLKAKLLKKEKLNYHERNVPTGSIDHNYGYKNAVDIVGNALKNIDPEFEKIFQGFTTEGRIDVFPQKGKTGGAFQVSFGHNEENFILLNYNNELNDITTLAHETGHGIHTILSKKAQNSLQSDYGMAVAEVASTFMEGFVLDKIMNTIAKEEELIILMEDLNDSISTIHRQVALYLFEIELHKSFREKGYLNHQEIGKIFQKHMKSYMGNYVNQDEGSQNFRVYRSHIRYFFYVYSYAGGLLIAKALQVKVKNDPKFIIKMKKEFLSAGSSKSPKEIFKNMGIDITKKTFRQQGLKEIEKKLKKAEKIARQLGKI